MQNEKLLTHMLETPIPTPVRRLSDCRMRTPDPDQIFSFRDIFLTVVADLYYGHNQPPKGYRLFDRDVLNGGLVQYDPRIKSWKSLLAHTAELLQCEGTLAEKRTIFESWLPKRLGWMNPEKLAEFLGELQQTIRQVQTPIFIENIELERTLDCVRKVLDR